jgi:hypothetical protein
MTRYKFLAIALLLSGSLGLGLPGCDRDNQTGDQSRAKGGGTSETGSERAGKTGSESMPSQGPGGPASGQGSGASNPGPAGR